jgi:peptide/nickel transport system ATP-binding protein
LSDEIVSLREQETMPLTGDEIVRVVDLKKYFDAKLGFLSQIMRKRVQIKAVDGVSLAIKKGEIFGIAGESGCGKTTLGRTILRLTKATSGKIYFKGEDITRLPKKRAKRLRITAQIVFQDPYESMNPRMSVYDIVSEGLRVNRHLKNIRSEEQISEMVSRALSIVQLIPPEQFLQRFPHELSGGQRQRVAVARALILDPEFIVADEPVSMLDVSIRAEVLNVMMDLRQNFGLSFLMITHDLALAKHVCDRLAIMYLGKIVELAESEVLVDKPYHPYSQALVAAIPVPDPDGRKVKVFAGGEIPSAVNIPSGCRFHTRCPYAKEKCRASEPDLRQVETGHWVACHYYEEAYDTFRAPMDAQRRATISR